MGTPERPASYAHGTGPEPLIGETIGTNLERTAARVPDSDALVSCHQDARFTWAELNAAVDRLALGLLGLGLAKGDRLGIWSPNRYEWALVQYATAKLGVILVNVNPAYRSSELEFALRQSGCRVLVSAPEFKGSDYAAMVAEVRDSLPALERVVLLDSPEWAALAAGEGGPDAAELRARMDALGCDDPINIQYTSGTTGSPKGATLTHHNILNNALLQSGVLGYTEADRVCIPVPLYHCFGMVLGNLACSVRGACMVYPEAAFEPLATFEAVARERCTSLYGVPTMFIAELDHPRFAELDVSSLRTGIMAGSPCPIEVMRRVGSEMGVDEMTIAFGMTETSPASTMVRRDDTLEHRCETVGEAMPHTEIKIVDPASGRTVPRGESGEFCARGYLVMSGYWDEPERTARGDRRGRLDAHRRPGDDGRRRVRAHRRPDQGHDHPRRRERLPARGRGVPLRPPRRGRRAGGRRAGRPLRRGGHGLGDRSRGRDRGRGGAARVLPRQDRALQGSSLRGELRRVPDDRHGEGPEAQAARTGDRAARTGRGRRAALRWRLRGAAEDRLPSAPWSRQPASPCWSWRCCSRRRPPRTPPRLRARGSIEQAYVLGAKRGQRLQLRRRARQRDRGRPARPLRQQDLPRPAAGRRLPRPPGPQAHRARSACCARARTRRARSTAGVKLKQGLNYVKMRDGVELAMTVRLPSGKTLADGPFPTFIEYSGYQVAAPHDLLSSILSRRRTTRSRRRRRPPSAR